MTKSVKPLEIVKFRPLKSRKGTPVLPARSNFMTPSRQSSVEKEVFSVIRRDFSAVYREVKKLVEALPVRAITGNASTVNRRRYEYLLDAEAVDSLTKEFNRILTNEIIKGRSRGGVQGEFFTDARADRVRLMSTNWMDVAVDRSFIAGTRDALESAKRVAPSAVVGGLLSTRIRAITTESELMRGLVTRRAAITQARSFEAMQGLVDDSRKALSQALTTGILNGDGVVTITKSIREAIGSSVKRAQTIARTEINQAYRYANRAETESINKQMLKDSQWELRFLWFSALTSTTRTTHAERHGKVFTKEEIDEFYSEDANAINCYCSQTPVMYNTETGEVLQQDMMNEMSEQRKEWEEAA